MVVDSQTAFSGGINLCFGRWDTWNHPLTDYSQLFPGKDYWNERVHCICEVNTPFKDKFDRRSVPRMPWHDVQQMVVGQPAHDLARHFVQRWNSVAWQGMPQVTPLLLPPPDIVPEPFDTGTCEYQVLRSLGMWSSAHEQSIQDAYVALIEESEHFVYIENQFFSTSTEVDSEEIQNLIGEALFTRALNAYLDNQGWRAFILIPLLPGFEGSIGDPDATNLRTVCECQYRSISQGPNSIFERLRRLGVEPESYIIFLSLRKWDRLPDGMLCTEQVYIHSKCMIVDDRVAIIGSANINDRSMLGTRDSELAVCVRDTQLINSRMAGKPWKAGRFAHSLRVRLMREHAGLNLDELDSIEGSLQPGNLFFQHMRGPDHRARLTGSTISSCGFTDPLDKCFVTQWLGIARENTRIFREVFHCQPDDEVRDWEDYYQYEAHQKVCDVGAEEKLQGVTGNLVLFPTRWMCSLEHWRRKRDFLGPLAIYS